MTAVATGATAAVGSPAKPLYTDGYKRVVLGMLVMAYTFNFIDRTIISTIGQAIKVDLKLTDTQLGYLGGLYFALLYTLLGVPIARLAERFNRTSIIAAALVIWSGFTVACGFAGNFVQLALCRFGVGVGEAGCSPPAHSLISDYYEPKRRSSALAIYSFGIPLGTMIGAVSGGYLAENFSWRIAFVIVGLPGLILALLVKLLVKEPPRGHSDIVSSEHPVLDEDLTVAPSAPAFSMAREFSEIWAVVKRLFGNWGVLNMVLGVTIASFGSYGSGAFVPPYFVRQFGLGLAQVGLITGLIGGFSAGIGTLVGGFLTDWASKRSPAWYGLVPGFGLAIATPIYITAYLQNDWKATAMILLIPGIFHYTYLGPTFGVVQNVIETRRRATATAVLFLFLNLIALGFGPPFTGWMIDHLAQFHFNNPSAPSIFSGLGGVFGDGVQSFNGTCPGGVAPKGSGPALAKACHDTLALSTRQGIIVSLCFYAWASFHYFMAARFLKRDMAKFANAV